MITSAQHNSTTDFEELYIQLREQEGRVYMDEEVAVLPEIHETHPHSREWQMRKQSCKKLISYIKKKQSAGSNGKSLKILEVGCGNGWLSHQLSTIPGCKVIGVDVNFIELQQAAKVFAGKLNLNFIYNDIASDLFEERQFDIIVFAASIQYFPSFIEITRKSLKLLNSTGEIHIIDSHFYPLSELNAAKQRSRLYFEAAGFPTMTNWYFHHSIDDLEQFDHSILYDPASMFNRFLKNKNPFPWICIKHNA